MNVYLAVTHFRAELMDSYKQDWRIAVCSDK